jgi:DNA-binding MarR family transcriptional regulator
MSSDPRLDAWRTLLTAHAEIVDLLAAELREEHHLPLSWYEVLLHLRETDDGRLRMHELAESLLLSRSAATRFVERMEHAGLVERKACEDDGRGTFVVMTAHGRETFRRAAPTHLEGIRRHFSDRLTDEEAGVIAAALRRVLAGISSGGD